MNTLTPQQIKEFQAQRAMIVTHNGMVAYSIFNRLPEKKRVRVLGISSPIEIHPSSVIFIDLDLSNVIAANDMDNPDGGTRPEFANSYYAAQKPAPKKKTILKSMK
jgi:hypothetical protein